MISAESRLHKTWKGYDVFEITDENGQSAWFAYPAGSPWGTPPVAVTDYWAEVRDWCTQHPNTLTA